MSKYVTTAEFNEFKAELRGNKPPKFEGDVGLLGKQEARILRLEKIIYGVGFVLAALQFAQPLIDQVIGGK